MEFKVWLNENTIKKATPVFSSWDIYGKVVVYIGPKQYTYYVDPVHLPRILNLKKFKPWSALNELKRLNIAF